MINKIKELQNKGLSIRKISEELNISKSKVEWEIKANKTESQDSQQDTISQDNVTLKTNILNEIPLIVKNKYPNLLLKDYKEDDFNHLGVKKLRKSDYTKEELNIFPDSPYYN